MQTTLLFSHCDYMRILKILVDHVLQPKRKPWSICCFPLVGLCTRTIHEQHSSSQNYLVSIPRTMLTLVTKGHISHVFKTIPIYIHAYMHVHDPCTPP